MYKRLVAFMRKKPLLGAFFLFFLLVTTASAGGSFQQTSTVYKKVGISGKILKNSSLQYVSWQGAKMRIDYQENQHSLLIDRDAQTVCTLDHQNKNYECDALSVFLRKKEREQEGSQYRKMQAGALLRVEGNLIKKSKQGNQGLQGVMTSTIKDRIKNYQKERSSHQQELKVVVQFPGNTKEMLGYSLPEVRVSYGGKKYLQAFLAEVGPPFYYRDYAIIVDMHVHEVIADLVKIKGFPFWEKHKISCGADKGGFRFTLVESFQEKDIPESFFEVPDSYHRKLEEGLVQGLDIAIDNTKELETW